MAPCNLQKQTILQKGQMFLKAKVEVKLAKCKSDVRGADVCRVNSGELTGNSTYVNNRNRNNQNCDDNSQSHFIGKPHGKERKKIHKQKNTSSGNYNKKNLAKQNTKVDDEICLKVWNIFGLKQSKINTI